MPYHFAALPDDLPDAWRALDRALYRWTRAHGSTLDPPSLELLARTAGWASLADGLGDTALDLRAPANGAAAMPPLDDAGCARLRTLGPLVSDGSGAPTAYVIDESDRFYLWRNHRAEQVLAAAICARLAAAQPVAVAAADLDVLFRGDHSATVQRQRDAVGNVAGRRLFVLTGGPGTGKTTTVLRMLLMLQRQHATPLTIRAAAPTGKAAQRLMQALRNGRQPLLDAESALPADWQSCLAAIPDGEALTLHRLLGLHPESGRYRHHAGNPLTADVVVVDEASMVDLGMMRALFDATRPDATLILLGDADQLASVAAGAALMDIVDALQSRGAPEHVRLEHSFRAEHPLQAVNDAIRRGDRAAFDAAIHAADTSIERIQVTDRRQLDARLADWARRIAELPIRPTLPAPAIADSRTGPADQGPSPLAGDELEKGGPAASDAPPEAGQPDPNSATAVAALAALATRQLLCALREGDYGAQATNLRIEQQLRRLWNVPPDAEWYPGRAVIVGRNDYVARLFNGDIGLCLADANGQLSVWFEATAADGTATARAFAPNALPDHATAFAITIHKSQGSEYTEAAVLLPTDAEHAVLSRQLLYTGASRARKRLQLWGTDAAFAAALARTVVRGSGLAAKLQPQTAAGVTGPDLLPRAR